MGAHAGREVRAELLWSLLQPRRIRTGLFHAERRPLAVLLNRNTRVTHRGSLDADLPKSTYAYSLTNLKGDQVVRIHMQLLDVSRERIPFLAAVRTVFLHAEHDFVFLYKRSQSSKVENSISPRFAPDEPGQQCPPSELFSCWFRTMFSAHLASWRLLTPSACTRTAAAK